MLDDNPLCGRMATARGRDFVVSNRQISAILPYRARGGRFPVNAGIVQILMRSLEAAGAADVLKTILVVTPPDEVDDARLLLAPWSDLGVIVENEEALIPGLRRYSGVHGWRKQQVIKLAAVRALDTPYVLTFDPDVICVKPMRFDDLIVGGRAVLDTIIRTGRPQWWRASGRLLGVPPNLDRLGISVTPLLLVAEVARDMLRFLEKRWARPWLDVLLRDHLGWWRSYWPPSRRRQTWSEYSLYFLYAESRGLVDRIHINSLTSGAPHKLISSNSVWRNTPFETWDPGLCFSADDPGLFCVVQSNKQIPSEKVWSRVAPHIARLAAGRYRVLEGGHSCA